MMVIASLNLDLSLNIKAINH